MKLQNVLFGSSNGPRMYLKNALIFLVTSFLILGYSRYSSAAEQTDDYILEDTVVTATKTGETRLQETPITISAFSDELLDNNNIDDLTSLSQYVPNTEFSQFGPGFTVAFIRGIGSTSVTSGSQAEVGFYVDGVFLERGFSADATFFDVERIEVLRGPQGTLYGRNTTAGAVNIITKKPSDELEVNIGVEVGNYGKMRFDASISGPILKDRIKARVSFVNSEHDGFVDNLTGPDTADEDFSGVRGAIEFSPTDNLEIMLRGDYFDSSPRSPANRMMTSTGLFTTILAPIFGIPPAPKDFYTVNSNGETLNSLTTYGFSGTVEVNLPYNQTLRSITAYRDVDTLMKQDVDTLPVEFFHLIQDLDYTTLSQEFQINGFSNRLKWVAGLYYIENTEEMNAIDYNMFFIIPGLNWVRTGKVESWSLAGYGSLNYSLSDRFSVEAGIRYTYEEVTNKFFKAVTNMPSPLATADLSGDKTNDWDSVTPSFKLSYQFSDDTLLYGAFSRGFKSGSFYMPNPPPDYWIDPEYLNAYEIGFKSDWFEKRLRLNGALFYYDFEDMQVKTSIPTGSVVKNAAEATIQGAELELLARPIPALTLNGSVSYLDSEYDEFLAVDAGGNPTDVSGNPLPYAPELKIVMGAQYVLNVGDYGFLTFRGDVTWTDDLYFDQFESPRSSREDLTLVDGIVRFETIDGRWNLEVYGKNLTEEEYLLGTAELIGDVQGNVAPPRTYGVQVVYRY